MTRVQRGDADDLEELLRIADERRAAYATYQPQFWRPASDAVERQRAYFGRCLEDPHVCVLVAREAAGDVRGFAIGRLSPPPPVYDPGGSSCVVDDLAVVRPEDWLTDGHLLLDGLRSWAADRGSSQIIVVTARLDEAKRAALLTHGLSLASEWWVGSIT